MQLAQKIKNTLFFISNILKTPALIYHELWHLILCLFTWTEVVGIDIIATDSFKKDFSYSVGIRVNPKNYFKNMLIALAPFIGMIIAYFACLYFDSLLLFTYCFFSSKVLMPSKEDLDLIDSYKTDDELLQEMLKDEEEIRKMLEDDI